MKPARQENRQMTMIDKHFAAQLAVAYADAMELTSRRTYHPQTTPRKVVDTYLHWSKVTGIKLHNDAWEVYAERVVDELNAKRRAAWAKVINAA
jgi:hypothetical protein